ncbi:MAG: 2-hydroxyglutaryl-CoA dehydratase, partial [bacterium]|nr:2-hydroxyglutaryl-CoA dehydratase [bacterium]
MIFAGCDVGSLTAKAVLLNDRSILSSKIIRVKETALKSATAVMNESLLQAGKAMEDIDFCCCTGYGRFDIPFSNLDKSEISCHGLGAFWTDDSIRTIIDIGGQDCKVVSIDGNGMVDAFVMNEKCAAG